METKGKEQVTNYMHDFLNKMETSHKSYTRDSMNMLEIMPALIALQNDKGQAYGRSYCKHGDMSIFFNCERKFDRITHIMEKAMKSGTDTLYSDEGGTATETFLDTVVDLANYSLMWVGYIKENHPEEWAKFVVSNHLTEKIS